MTMLWVAALWALLSLLLFVRLRVILAELSLVIRPGTGWLKIPSFDLRPLKHLAAWAAEVLMLALWYDLAGISVIAHLAAAFCALGMSIMMRDRSETNWLRSLQLMAMSETMA
jgi:hypothetical protein